MSDILESYVAGRWVAGTGAGREVRDAVTANYVLTGKIAAVTAALDEGIATGRYAGLRDRELADAISIAREAAWQLVLDTADAITESDADALAQIAQLDQEGLVRVVARRGIYIVRKTKAEILDMITVWAALESMAARLATKVASASRPWCCCSC